MCDAPVAGRPDKGQRLWSCQFIAPCRGPVACPWLVHATLCGRWPILQMLPLLHPHPHPTTPPAPDTHAHTACARRPRRYQEDVRKRQLGALELQESLRSQVAARDARHAAELEQEQAAIQRMQQHWAKLQVSRSSPLRWLAHRPFGWSNNRDRLPGAWLAATAAAMCCHSCIQDQTRCRSQVQAGCHHRLARCTGTPLHATCSWCSAHAAV